MIVTIGPWHEKPWWWQHINFDTCACGIDYERISFGNKKPAEISIFQLPKLFHKLLIILLKCKYKFIFTFECGPESFLIALFQTITFRHSPKHVILQFIMREKKNSLKSKLKYFFMRFCFVSLHMAICSSKAETEYYKAVFGWDEEKVKYVPFHTDPEFLNPICIETDNYILAAGRTFRDYETFFSAVEELDVQAIVVTSPQGLNHRPVPKNIQIIYELSLSEFTEMMRRSLIVVVPLQDRKISVGQSVVLQAMAMGKPVIATRTNGTVDYIDHMTNGVLVEPYNKDNLKNAISMLSKNRDLRETLARNGRESIIRKHLPQHYFERTVELLKR